MLKIIEFYTVPKFNRQDKYPLSEEVCENIMKITGKDAPVLNNDLIIGFIELGFEFIEVLPPKKTPKWKKKK